MKTFDKKLKKLLSFTTAITLLALPSSAYANGVNKMLTAQQKTKTFSPDSPYFKKARYRFNVLLGCTSLVNRRKYLKKLNYNDLENLYKYICRLASSQYDSRELLKLKKLITNIQLKNVLKSTKLSPKKIKSIL